MDFTSLHRLASDQASGLVAVGKGATIPITNVEEAFFKILSSWRSVIMPGRFFGVFSFLVFTVPIRHLSPQNPLKFWCYVEAVMTL
jgi:hypothetical protein